MTTYTKRDIKAADLLALFFCGLGIVLMLVALDGVFSSESGESMVLEWICAVSSLTLGIALNLKVRQLVRNKGKEPEQYEGVPE